MLNSPYILTLSVAIYMVMFLCLVLWNCWLCAKEFAWRLFGDHPLIQVELEIAIKTLVCMVMQIVRRLKLRIFMTRCSRRDLSYLSGFHHEEQMLHVTRFSTYNYCCY